MQRHFLEKMRHRVVGVGRMPLEREFASSPEPNKVARHQGDSRRIHLPLHPQHAEASEHDQRQNRAGTEQLMGETRLIAGPLGLGRRDGVIDT